jgi:aspartate-semialdehyde dehydrogenase
VISNSRNHRYDPDVPILVPDVNPEHLAVIRTQPYGKGAIITNPNCSATGLVVALKPLLDNFGLEAVSVVTMQAISGAGYPGVASHDIIENVVPFIGGESRN